MTYLTNTLTDSNAPATLYAAMATALSTEGYTLVDTVTISTRTHKVWKNAAANNPANADWYLDIAYTTTGAGTLGLYPMEYFDPATDLAYRAPYYSSSSTVPETTYYSRWGATGYALESGSLGIYAGATYSGGNAANRDLSIPATTFGYWISITPRRVAIFTSNQPTIMLYGGLYEPHADFAAQAGGLMFPLGSFRFTSAGAYGSQGDASLTRYPKETTAGTGWSARCESNGVNLISAFSGFPSIPSGVTTLSAVRRAARVPISTTSSATASALYGYLYDVLVANTTAVRGDTVTIGGASYVFTTPSTNYALLMKAA